MTTPKAETMSAQQLYLGDNGRCTCMPHAGATAQASGRDISGQRLHRLTNTERAEFAWLIGREPTCESCAATAKVAA